MRANKSLALFVASAAIGCAWYTPLWAQQSRPSQVDSFRIGSDGNALCQAQSKSGDAAVVGMFDRSWTVVCRDASQPVGQLFALRGDTGAADARILQSPEVKLSCGDWLPANVTGLADVVVAKCGANRSVYRYRSGKISYYAQGLNAYDAAVRLGLRTVVADRLIAEKIEVATTGSGDASTFARAQAETLDMPTALAEGYRRNNSGNFVEAAQFFDTLQRQVFDTLQQQTQASSAGRQNETETQRMQRLHEYAVNRALQLSNLGEFEQADGLFAQADRIPLTDRVQLRLRRNFKAMHFLNQRRLGEAIAVLDAQVLQLQNNLVADQTNFEISEQVAAEINGGDPNLANLGVKQETSLTPNERAAIIDAQALQLKGTIQRLQGKPGEALANMRNALTDAVKIRNGRVVSIARLRAQIITEMALAEEDAGNFGRARALFDDALLLLSTTYPETNALNNVRARLAAFLARRGNDAEALSMYRQVIATATENGIGTTGLTNQLKPYFDLLSSGIAKNPALVDDLFLASQTLIRPGAADSMEVLSRELLADSSEAAGLFRQSVTLSRDIERGRIELARLVQLTQQDGSALPLLTAQQTKLKTLTEQQTLTQASLATYPQFRAVSKQTMSLSELRAILKPGEAYMKLAVSGDGVYAVFADTKGATGYRLPVTAAEMSRKVSDLRATISTLQNGTPTTFAFNVTLGRELFLDLFAPVADRLKETNHLIFEPDGAMLQLPVNLLIAEQSGVNSYLARSQQSGADEFDFRGITWLGRSTAVSTSISARSFRDARVAPASNASRQYLGFGNNAPAFAQLVKAPPSNGSTFDSINCDWPLAQWNRPIADSELLAAANVVGSEKSRVITGRAFTDNAVKALPDLADYRILHFATHGFVTAPQLGCPARPSLLTSIGSADSDGLLSFSEIFDLKIDADVVILSACDTAGQASAFATEEAGLRNGGGTALDGLVRAFIGAGGRSVIASHWPAPDEFQATERLISGLFLTKEASVAEAMRQTQTVLMDDANTSHPFYWSGFAVVGDGARKFLGNI